MTRVASGIVAVVLLSTGTAYGQGQVVSYYGFGTSGFVIIPEVPAGGLVITDFVTLEPVTFTVKENGVTKYRSWGAFTNNGISGVVSFNSGIAFAEGSEITVQHGSPGTPHVTLMGYIPAGAGAVPAVGAWGLLVMVLLIVGAGSVVFRRMRVAA